MAKFIFALTVALLGASSFSAPVRCGPLKLSSTSPGADGEINGVPITCIPTNGEGWQKNEVLNCVGGDSSVRLADGQCAPAYVVSVFQDGSRYTTADIQEDTSQCRGASIYSSIYNGNCN